MNKHYRRAPLKIENNCKNLEVKWKHFVNTKE